MSGNPWFRLYTEFASDAKVQMLAFEDQRHYVMVLCLEGNGTLHASVPSEQYRERLIAKALGLDPMSASEAKRRLVEGGLIGDDWHPLKWDARQFKSDHDAAERKRNQRLRERHNDVTTESRDNHVLEQNRTDTEQSKRARAATASRLSADFALTPEMIEYAKAQKVDPHRTFENFCDYWRAASGAKARKHDWLATWRMWCRREHEAPTGKLTRPGAAQAPNHDAAWAEARSRATAIGFRQPSEAESATSYATAVRLAETTPRQAPMSERRGLSGLKRIAG